MRLGIETEFFLAPHQHSGLAASRLEDFVRILARNHNKEVWSQRPRMHHSMRLPNEPDDYTTWSMVQENTVATAEELCELFRS